ncbi:MAG: hypothetical protein DWQ44_06980 [Bacteroidetes bacterium]|nr:MAG: hypothetical protein DWQ33_12710 [Bacteroidota bacterium]REJ99759.1 MAG: hypothetical protein DWQ39_12600 [Bacteroidota bacterium]REK34132.1 MAG: hypothetical protein DWQ44_06980 [Bacteroidota bacterium]REK50463.1 MAG: hypothetical protein DWQ48_03890 [Bacteroidota bacterium]
MRKNLFRIFLVCLIFHLPHESFADGEDSLTSQVNKTANRRALQSALLPGLGQAMNGKLWKIPVLYAGFGTLVYFIGNNDQEYNRYKNAFIQRNDGDPATVDEFSQLTSEDLRVRKDFYRRNRDLSYILTGVLYAMNIVDAYVDAQLKDFDVSENLSFRPAPCIDLNQNANPVAGIKLIFTIK